MAETIGLREKSAPLVGMGSGHMIRGCGRARSQSAVAPGQEN